MGAVEFSHSGFGAFRTALVSPSRAARWKRAVEEEYEERKLARGRRGGYEDERKTRAHPSTSCTSLRFRLDDQEERRSLERRHQREMSRIHRRCPDNEKGKREAVSLKSEKARVEASSSRSGTRRAVEAMASRYRRRGVQEAIQLQTKRSYRALRGSKRDRSQKERRTTKGKSTTN